MSIPLKCACGKSLRVKDEYAGKRAKCPACGQTILVPPLVVPAMPRDAAKNDVPEHQQPSPQAHRRNLFKLQRGTSITLGIIIALLVLLNLFIVRKLTLHSHEFKERVVLNAHGWPMPVVSVIVTSFDMPKDTSDPFGHVQRLMLPDDMRMDNNSNVTFKDGSKVSVDYNAFVMDTLISLGFLALVFVICERWLFRPAKRSLHGG